MQRHRGKHEHIATMDVEGHALDAGDRCHLDVGSVRHQLVASMKIYQSNGMPDGMQRYVVPPSPCPICACVHECATGPFQPEPGCFSTCDQCGSWNRFDANMQLQLATSEEIRAMPDEQRDDLKEMSSMVQKRNAARRSGKTGWVASLAPHRWQILQECYCPSCGFQVREAYQPFSDTGPKTGDYGLCTGCAALLVLIEDGSLVAATDSDLEHENPRHVALMRDAQAKIAARLAQEPKRTIH